MVPIQTFSDLRTVLNELNWQGSPSEMHGAICGYLASGIEWSDASWPIELIGEPRSNCTEQVHSIVMTLARQAQASLESDDLDFAPWLADDETPLSSRVETMTLWCRGFLGGFGLGNPEQPLASEVDEALQSFAVIAAAPPSLGKEDEDESAWMELVEFIRVSALLCHSYQARRP